MRETRKVSQSYGELHVITASQPCSLEALRDPQIQIPSTFSHRLDIHYEDGVESLSVEADSSHQARRRVLLFIKSRNGHIQIRSFALFSFWSEAKCEIRYY